MKIRNYTLLKLFFIFFAISFIFRLPTLFNDYYDVDELAAIVQAKEWLAGKIPGEDFHESKLPVYHLIFKASYTILPENGWIIVHLITIIIITFTSFFIYLIGKKLKGYRAGLIGAILYSVLISSFNRQFMATNGEIVFNLPITASVFFMIMVFKSHRIIKKTLYILLFVLSGITAANIKFHGIIIFIATFFFFIFYYPYMTNKFSKKHIIIILGLFTFVLLVASVDYFILNLFSHKLLQDLSSKIFYAIEDKGLNPIVLLIKFIHRQGLLLLWHFVAWIPMYFYMKNFIIKDRLKSKNLSQGFLILTFIFTYIMIFGGGSRLYFHYFMASYPSLCAISGIVLSSTNFNNKIITIIKNKFIVFLMIPGFFFFSWNVKDVIIKHYYPQYFLNEGKILFWLRAVIMGTWNNYLLPANSYRNACIYIENNSNKFDRIFVWGDGPYINYFSKRYQGGFSLWPKNSIIKITNAYNDSNFTPPHTIEKKYIELLKKNKPIFIVDTSENGLSNFNFKISPFIKKYILENYKFETEINKIKIYRRRINK